MEKTIAYLVGSESEHNKSFDDADDAHKYCMTMDGKQSSYWDSCPLSTFIKWFGFDPTKPKTVSA